MGTLRPPFNILTAILRPPSNIPSGPCSLSGLFSRWFFCCGFFPRLRPGLKVELLVNRSQTVNMEIFLTTAPTLSHDKRYFGDFWPGIAFLLGSHFSLTHSWTYDSIFVFGSRSSVAVVWH